METSSPDHAEGQCPGLGQCDYAWHLNGCDPYVAYFDASGMDISGSPTAELDATHAALWRGPDGPDDEWERAPGGEWVSTGHEINPKITVQPWFEASAHHGWSKVHVSDVEPEWVQTRKDGIAI